MKKIIITLVAIIVLCGVGFGVWGYVKAQEVKKQGKLLEQITAETMNLKEVRSGDERIEISDWKNLAEQSPVVLKDLKKVTVVQDDLKNKISQFYGTESQDKYKEAQYLEILIEAQSSLDLKNNQPKSKGQMETVLTEFDKMQKSLDQNKLTSGAEIDVALAKFHQEAPLFQASAMDIANKMNFSSPGVQLNVAGLDKAIDELKQALAKSLNDHVKLQNDIKKEITNFANINWVMPF